MNTTELLENILLVLPIKTIVILQSVCRQFKEVISTSPTIQQRLWLRPKPCAAPQSPGIRALSNPLLTKGLGRAEYDGNHVIRVPCKIFRSRVNLDATWRNMALIDSPATNIKVILYLGIRANPRHFAFTLKKVKDNAGVTLGKAIDAIFGDAGQIGYSGPSRANGEDRSRVVFGTIDEALREFAQVAGGKAYVKRFLIDILYEHADG